MSTNLQKRHGTLQSAGRALGWTAGVVVITVAIFALAVWGATRVKADYTTADSGWAQAIGAVLAIVVGFTGTAFQLRTQRRADEEKEQAAGRAAYLLTYDAFETVSERLAACLVPNRNKKTHALRGSRTTEMVTAMREFDTSKLPDDMLADFIRIRSRVFAINERITEIYTSESKLVGDKLASEKRRRYTRLRSAVVVRGQALTFLTALTKTATTKNGAVAEQLTIYDAIINYDFTREEDDEGKVT